MAEALRLYFPELLVQRSPADLDRLCSRAWEIADENALPDEGDVYILAVALMVYGEELHVRAPWLEPALQDRSKSAADRIDYIAAYMTIDQEKQRG